MPPCATALPPQPMYDATRPPPASTPFAQHFGHVVRAFRCQQEISLPMFARQLNVSPGWLEAVEGGMVTISLEHALLLAIPLQFSLDTFYPTSHAISSECLAEMTALLPLLPLEVRRSLFAFLHEYYASRPG